MLEDNERLFFKLIFDLLDISIFFLIFILFYSLIVIIWFYNYWFVLIEIKPIYK